MMPSLNTLLASLCVLALAANPIVASTLKGPPPAKLSTPKGLANALRNAQPLADFSPDLVRPNVDAPSPFIGLDKKESRREAASRIKLAKLRAARKAKRAAMEADGSALLKRAVEAAEANEPVLSKRQLEARELSRRALRSIRCGSNGEWNFIKDERRGTAADFFVRSLLRPYVRRCCRSFGSSYQRSDRMLQKHSPLRHWMQAGMYVSNFFSVASAVKLSSKPTLTFPVVYSPVQAQCLCRQCGALWRKNLPHR